MEPRLISRRKDTYDVTDAASKAKLLRSLQLAVDPAICDPVAAATACAVAAHVADTACHPASKASCGQVVGSLDLDTALQRELNGIRRDWAAAEAVAEAKTI